MEKNTILKVVNPALSIFMLNQPFSALLIVIFDWDFFEGLHVLGGVLLLCAAAVHLALNWRWVTANFTKKTPHQRG